MTAPALPPAAGAVSHLNACKALPQDSKASAYRVEPDQAHSSPYRAEDFFWGFWASSRAALVRRERGTEARDQETLKRQGSLSFSPIDDLE